MTKHDQPFNYLSQLADFTQLIIPMGVETDQLQQKGK